MKKFTFALLVIFSILIIGCFSPRQAFNTLFDNTHTISVAERDERTITLQPQAVFSYRGAIIEHRFWTPHRIAFDKAGYVYGLFQADNGREWTLLQFEPTGKLNKEIRRIREIPGTVTSTAKMRTMDLVRDIRGNFIILDVYTSEILKIDITGKLVGSFQISDDSTVRAHAIAIDKNDQLYVVTSEPKRIVQGRNCQILKFDLEGNLIETLKLDSRLSGLTGLTVNSANELYAILPVGKGLCQSTIFRLNSEGKVIDKWMTPGYWKNIYAEPQSTHLALDAAGNVYVATFYEMDVQIYSPDGWLLARFLLPIPEGGNPELGSGALPRPRGIAVNQQGEIFVADRGIKNGAILKYVWKR